MGKVLIIGAGGVGTVVVHKVVQNSDVFTEIVLASRTKSKCDILAEEIKKKYGVEIKTAPYEFCPVNCPHAALTIETQRLYADECVIQTTTVHCKYEDVCGMWAERLGGDRK